MTLEDTIRAAVTSAVTPLVAEIHALRAQVERLSSALPDRALATVPQAAAALQLSTATVRRRIKSGDIAVRRVGRSVRVDLAAVQRGPDLSTDSRSQ